MDRRDSRHSAIFCGGCGERAESGERYCVRCGSLLRQPGTHEPARAAGRHHPRTIALANALQLLGENRFAAAEPILAGLVEDTPDWGVAHASLARAYLGLGRPEDASECIERALALAPEDFLVRTTHADLLTRVGAYDRAIGELEVALDLRAPDEPSRLAALELLRFCRERILRDSLDLPRGDGQVTSAG